MGCGGEKAISFLSRLAVHKKSEGNLCNEKPVFCDNGASLIISSGKSCHLYSTATGNHTKKLFQCADDIICCQLHPTYPFQVIAITENGEVTVYNLKTSEIESSIKLALSVKILKKQNPPKFINEEGESDDEDFDWGAQLLDSLSHRKFIFAEVKAFQNNPSNIYIWATWSLNDESKAHLSVFTFNSGKHIGLIHLRKTGLKKCYLNFVVGTIQNLDILVGMSSQFVHVARFDIKKTNFYKKHYIGHTTKLTCLALHPVECMFATGDSSGRITIWRNIFEKHPLKDVFHWHALPVQDLFFSKSGNYLFSGGLENVLVKWSLSSRSRDFFPRLSSTIHHISGASEASLLSISTRDNKILIVDFNFKSISTIQHFSKWSVLKGENKFNIFTIDPRTNCLVLNGKTGHIQFLSLEEHGKFVYTFDVTNRNFISSDINSAIKNTEVTHAKFSKCGKWLVTAELKKEGLHKESCLKFWMYCKKEGSFTLNTNVELPHEESGICSLEISTDDTVATTGYDNKFRLWTLFDCQQGTKFKEIWSVLSVRKYRNLPCLAIDFSKDSSLVSVTFGPVLTVWETESCDLKCSLSVPNKKDFLTSCKFGNNEFSHLIVTGTTDNVSSWNTITLSMIWTVPLKLSLLVSDPFSVYMIAFSNDNSLIIFNPASPSPDFVLKNICDSPVASALCSLDEAGRFCLYFLTSKQELFCLEDTEKASSINSCNVSNSYLTPYSAQLAQIQNPIDKEKTKMLNKTGSRLVSSLLDSPAHTLPNPSSLCLDILKGLLMFTESQPIVSLSNEEKKNDFVKINKSQSENADINSHQIENKLVNIVQTIFD